MMSLSAIDRQKEKNDTLIGQYDIVADAKNRISLRGPKSKYFHVRAFSNGCYVLEPRILVIPPSLSDRSLKMIDQSVAHLLDGKSSAPIDLASFI